MSEVNTPASSTTTTTTEAPVSNKSKGDVLRAKLADAAKESFALSAKGPTTVTPTPSTDARVEAKVDAIEEATGEAPEQKAGESDESFEVRLDKIQKELEAERLQTAKYRKSYESEAKKAKELEGKMKPKDIHDALERLGTTYAQLIQDARDGKVPAPPPAPKSPTEEALEKRLAELEAERNEQKTQVQRAGHLDVISREIKAKAQDLPLAASLPWVAETALNEIYATYESTGKEPGVQTILAKYDAAIRKDAAAILGNTQAVKVLLQDEALKKTVMEALGLSDAQPVAAPASRQAGKKGSEDGPRALSSKVTSIVPPRTEPLTAKERREKAAEVAAQMFARKG